MVGFPGGNILALANRVIAPQQMQYRPYISRTLNVAGVYITNYAGAAAITANIQPIQRERYEVMGLDMQKTYVNIYVQKNIIDIAREVTGDQFWYSGRLYEAESRTSWFAQDGWDAVLCVEVPGYTPPFPVSEECCTNA
jgi:hypothetical protein